MKQLKQAIEVLINTQQSADNISNYHLVIANIFLLLVEIERLELQGLPKEEIVEALEKARGFISQSPFYYRLQNWPRGYPGDFETIEYLLNAKNQAKEGSISFLLEEYGMVSPAAQQHRNKLAHQTHLITKTFREKQNRGEKLRVLSVGCGGCPDIRQAEHYLIKEQSEFVLIDGDQNALNFAKENFLGLEAQCEFVCANILRQLKSLKERENFDLVLTGGLFDYFGEKSITKILNHFYQHCLNDDGIIFFTNISPRNIDRLWIEYLCNWNLICRSEETLNSFCLNAEIPSKNIKICKDQTGLTYFVELTKT